jgi:hypothetical protein
MNVFSLDYLRQRGFSDIALFPDEELVSAEQRVWIKIERFCLQFFEPRTFSDTISLADYPSLHLDGSGRNILPLPLPIISLNSVTEDSDSIALTDIIIYNRYYPDDRYRPRLQYEHRYNIFPRGNQNIVLDGVFGFVEKDGTTPADLQEAAIKMMLFELAPFVGKAGFKLPRIGVITQEMADKYSYKIQPGETLNGVTGVPEIDKVLYKYRRSDDALFGGVV